ALLQHAHHPGRARARGAGGRRGGRGGAPGHGGEGRRVPGPGGRALPAGLNGGKRGRPRAAPGRGDHAPPPGGRASFVATRNKGGSAMARIRPSSIRWLLIALLAGLLAACATGPRVSSDADPRADFSAYRTFAFYSPLAIEREGYASLVSGRMKAAARAEMEARGYVYSEQDPDLWLNINAYLQQRTDVSTVPAVDYGYYYSYRYRGYVAVPFWHERTTVSRYTEGTMNIDLVDARRNALVWEGIATGRARRNQDPAERDAAIDATIAAIFAQYPHRAGAR